MKCGSTSRLALAEGLGDYLSIHLSHSLPASFSYADLTLDSNASETKMYALFLKNGSTFISNSKFKFITYQQL